MTVNQLYGCIEHLQYEKELHENVVFKTKEQDFWFYPNRMSWVISLDAECITLYDDKSKIVIPVSTIYAVEFFEQPSHTRTHTHK